MKKLTKILFLILLLSALRYPLSATYAAVPHLINYQGRLTDSGGVPLNGSYNLTFKIYDSETAGNLLWEETQSGVVIQKGIFSILLGSVTNLNIPFDKPYWLEIKVGNEVMSPRQRITSAGYAIRAEKAEKIKADSEDTIEGYLSDKVDNLTIKVNTSTHKLYVASSGQQLFTSSGLFTAPAGVTKVYITGIGGGGGGGHGQDGETWAGGGGGAGAYVFRYPYQVTPGNSYAVIIGLGGTGGASSSQRGGNGSASVFDGLTLNYGSGGGGGGGGGNGAAGGSSGTASINYNASGINGGGSGIPTNAGGNGAAGESGGIDTGGGGGGSPFGAGGNGGADTQSGSNGSGFGSGGGGTGAHSAGTKGGDGKPGYILIEW